MNKLREAAQMALEALETLEGVGTVIEWDRHWKHCHVAITALRAALAQPEPDPTHAHEWFKTGAMSVDEMRCIQCGEWWVKP